MCKFYTTCKKSLVQYSADMNLECSIATLDRAILYSHLSEITLRVNPLFHGVFFVWLEFCYAFQLLEYFRH